MKVHTILLCKIFLLLFSVCASCANAQKAKMVAGDYDDILHFAYEKGGNSFTGYIDYNPYEGDKSSIQISCSILFRSLSSEAKKNGYYDIEVFNSEDGSSTKTPGEINIDSNKIYLRIGNYYPSCNNVLDFTSERGATFRLSKKRNYHSFNLIKSEKSFIYTSPNVDSASRKYLINGNFIHVIETRGKYSKIEFYGKKLTVGWVLNSDMIFNPSSS